VNAGPQILHHTPGNAGMTGNSKRIRENGMEEMDGWMNIMILKELNIVFKIV
jgi:hypothetical protein